jgi:hypothetical protein
MPRHNKNNHKAQGHKTPSKRKAHFVGKRPEPLFISVMSPMTQTIGSNPQVVNALDEFWVKNPNLARSR